MNSYLYRAGWWNDSITFTYNLDYLDADSTIDRILNGYIATKLGSCVTMPMLHLVLAQRLGWPIKPVRSAKHFYCRYIQKGLKEDNIEATCGGGYIPTWRYARDAGETKKAIKNGVYERTLTNKEYIASLLDANARYFKEKKNDLDKAIYYTQLILKYDTTYAGAYWNLGEYYREKAIELDSTRYERIQEVKREYGVVNRHSENQFSPQVRANPNLQPKQPVMSLDQYLQLTKSGNPIPQTPASKILDNIDATMDAPQVTNHISPDIQRQNDEAEMMGEIVSIDDSYGKQILQIIDLSHKLKAKAKQMGIVLKFPKEFFIKQAVSIEKFKRTGQY